MGTLVISRTRQYANMARRCSILVDDKHVAYVSHGETIEIPVDDGDHTVVAKMDWCRSTPLAVSVQPDSTVKLRTGCYAKGFGLYLAIIYIMIPGWYLYVEPAEELTVPLHLKRDNQNTTNPYESPIDS
jgi:hypothetical protein